MPEGAFYAFSHVAALFGKSYGGQNASGSVELCTYLLEEAHVALVPGAAFGCDDYIRLSYAAGVLASLKHWLEDEPQIVELVKKVPF